ncbi:MAG: DNA translocase FtsK [Paludibacteraceae bacterium]|nr:DNA translocase FtsK [Paludibacteraceae bacterium]
MATRRPTRPSRQSDIEVVDGGNKKRLNLQDLKKVSEFFQNERVQLVCGILLAAFTLYLTIVFISYFFTGSADFSLMEQPHEGTRALRHNIQNWGGLEGAAISQFLIDRTFGIASVAILVFMALWAVRLVYPAFTFRGWRLFFCSAFWLIWGSFILGFIQQWTGIDSFFRWGGVHGQTLSMWLTSYIQIIGVLLLLIAGTFIFFVCIDKNTIPNLQRFGQWVKSLFKKKERPANPDIDNPETPDSPETPDEPGLDTPEDPDIVILPDDNGDDNFTIKVGGEEEDPDNQDNPQSTDNPQTPDSTTDTPASDPELDINETEDTELSEDDPEYLIKKLGPYDPRRDLSHFKAPSLSLLKTYENETRPVIDTNEQQENKQRIIQAFRNFGIEIVSISATVGPTVTLYEIVPKEGVKIARITSLENDIMMSIAARGIRIIAPMPGKGTVGIEVPNKKPQVVSMHSVVASRRFQEEQKMRLPVVLGKTITNEVFMFDLAKAPHLLVAGATGQGKSVALNAIITSLLYKKHPAELKMVLVDPKMVEFSIYEPLRRHYMAAMPDYDPTQDKIIITDCTKVINTLNSLVIEMEERYTLLMDARVRNLEDYNEKFVSRRLNPEKEVKDKLGKELHHHFMPYIVIVIDEYGDFIMQAGKEVELPIARLTQKARAVGMHLILATQRPEVKIVTGLIKSNIPTRIALRTQSVIDSRTVLDSKGAEGLTGKGDMLYAANAELTRIQCAFVDTPEVEAIVDDISQQQSYSLPYQLPEYVGEEGEGDAVAPGSVDLKRLDPLFKDIATYVVTKQEGSTSKLQRAFEIGYNRAGKLTDQLEAAGIVGPNKGPKGRDVLVQDLGQLAQILESLGVR